MAGSHRPWSNTCGTLLYAVLAADAIVLVATNQASRCCQGSGKPAEGRTAGAGEDPPHTCRLWQVVGPRCFLRMWMRRVRREVGFTRWQTPKIFARPMSKYIESDTGKGYHNWFHTKGLALMTHHLVSPPSWEFYGPVDASPQDKETGQGQRCRWALRRPRRPRYEI